MEALGAGEPAADFSPTERLVHTATRALCRDRDLDDSLYRELVETVGREQLNELTILVGYYDLLALSLRVWRTPLPDDGSTATGCAGVPATDRVERP